MFDQEFIKAIIKQALQKGLLDGTSSVIEDLAYSLNENQLDRIITIFTRVRNRKLHTIDATEVRPRRA